MGRKRWACYAESARPFDVLVTPLTDVLIHQKQEKARDTNVLTDIFSLISNRLQKFFGNGWSNDLMVDDTGLEKDLLLFVMYRNPL